MDNNMILQDNLKSIEDASSKIRSFMNGIIDEGSFVETDVFACGKSFIDETEAHGEGVITGYATVSGNPVHIFAQNSEVLKGSLGMAHADKIIRCMRKAEANGTALISILDSAGARVGEGVEMLEAYARLIATASEVGASIPHICIVKGACVGMMSAFANVADFVFMADDAVMSVNSPMVLASNIKGYPKFSDVLGNKAHAAKSNTVEFTYSNVSDLNDKINKLLDFILVDDMDDTADDPNRESALVSGASVDDIMAALADNNESIEYAEAYANDIRCFFAKVDSIPVGIIAGNAEVNNGFTSVDGLKKAADFVDKLDSFRLPLITLVNTKGLDTTIESELSSASTALANLMVAINAAGVPKIAVVVGKAIGLGYSAFASKGVGFDYTIAFDDAEIAPINSNTAVNIVYADELKSAKDPIGARAELEKKYAEIEANPIVVARQGFLDNVIEPCAIRPYVSSALLMLLGL